MRTHHMTVSLCVFFAALLLLCLLPEGNNAEARVGGGQGYSRGSSSSSGSSSSGSYRSSSSSGSGFSSSSSSSSGGGGGGGDGPLPLILIGVYVLFVVGSKMRKRALNKDNSWTSASKPNWSPPPNPQAPVDFTPLSQQDPNFSRILLEDFLSGLFSSAHEARGGGVEGLSVLAPYLSDEARTVLSRRGSRTPDDVGSIIVGSLALTKLSKSSTAGTFDIEVDFEANYTESNGALKSRFYSVERWHLRRKLGVVSRSPDKLMALGCPNCGAPVEKSQDERCESCEAIFSAGEFDWFVHSIEVINEDNFDLTLTAGGYAPEQGTDLASVFDPDLVQAFDALHKRDPEFELAPMKARAEMIFTELQSAWSALEWDRARPYLTDRFWMAQMYWVEAYQTQGLRNVLDDMKIEKSEPVKITQDPFFDAITYRIWASCKDHTINDKSGETVSGDPRKTRRFSEYWTFIRSARATGAPLADKNCPNCSAPLVINQAGNCEHCSAKIIGGDFDWVLSRIEQDDSYAG